MTSLAESLENTDHGNIGRIDGQSRREKMKVMILTRPLLFLFLDRIIARMPTRIPCRNKIDLNNIHIAPFATIKMTTT